MLYLGGTIDRQDAAWFAFLCKEPPASVLFWAANIAFLSLAIFFRASREKKGAQTALFHKRKFALGPVNLVHDFALEAQLRSALLTGR